VSTVPPSNQGGTKTLEKTSAVEEVLSAKGSVAFSKAIEGRLFFSAESKPGWEVSTMRDGEPYRPVIFDPPFKMDAIGPSVVKGRKGYLMGVAVEGGNPPKRVIRFAESGSLDGPWHMLEESYSPIFAWEGRRIDLGPGSFVDKDSANFFYSSVYPRWSQMMGRLIRHPMLPTSRNLRRLVRRRIGILSFGLEDHKLKSTPEPISIPCNEGTVSESLFCPGYLNLGTKSLLFPAGSNYSMGYPYSQAILSCEGSDPLQWGKPFVLIDDDDLPMGGPASFDWADPVPNPDGSITLYFSAYPRKDAKWSIFKCQLKMPS
jgi:hypothetical protein